MSAEMIVPRRGMGRGRGFCVASTDRSTNLVGVDNNQGAQENPDSLDYYETMNLSQNGSVCRGRGRGGGRGRGRGSCSLLADDDREANAHHKAADIENGYGDSLVPKNNGMANYGNHDKVNVEPKLSEEEFKREDGDGEGSKVTEKPIERYIPPDPTEDESEIFGAGIESGINFGKYENISVKVSGENPPLPIGSFETAGLREFVLKNVIKSGYKTPTPVQKHSLPFIMNRRDVIASAQTGSGKTAAFLIPIINVLLMEPKELILTCEQCQPHVVAVTPTRELAIQIYNEVRKFSHGSTVNVALAYGGVASFYQSKQILKGCHILVGTPGRLNDYVQKGKISFASIRFFVLDEADRMLDMGFLDDMKKMLNHESMVPVTKRQTLMFSATFGEEVQKLATEYLNNYLFLAVGIVGGACDDVEQVFYLVNRFEKRSKLTELIKDRRIGGQCEKTLIFVEKKQGADFLAAFLSDNDFPTTSIHGDRLQREREEALSDFKSNRMPILVATAVAARGLDIKGVSHVVNYDMPRGIDEYVHRIGRTGRVGNKGKATSFYDAEQDSGLAKPLVRILNQAKQDVPAWLLKEAENSASTCGTSGRFGGRDMRRFTNIVSEGEDAQRVEPDDEDW